MFKYNPHRFKFKQGKIVVEDYKLQKTIKNGHEITELVQFEDDYTQVPPLIRPEDFTLRKQLDAGVQLNRVNVSGMFNPTDPASVQSLTESDAMRSYEKLQDELNNGKSEPTSVPPPEPTPLPTPEPVNE